MLSFNAAAAGAWRLFKSLRLTVVLLTLLIGASALGTLVVQRPSSAVAVERFHSPAGVQLLAALGLFDIYHSAWFVLLLFALSTNVLICTLDRLPRKWRLCRLAATALEPPCFRTTLLVTRRFAVRDLERLLTALRQGRWGFVQWEAVGAPEGARAAALFVRRRGRWSALNVVMVHAALLVIMAGALVDALWGLDGQMELPAGVAVSDFKARRRDGAWQVLPLPVSLRLKEFSAQYYPAGEPAAAVAKSYASSVDWVARGSVIGSGVIRVNGPLEQAGLRFHQAGFRSEPRAVLRFEDTQKLVAQELELGGGERAHVEPMALEVVALEVTVDARLPGHPSGFGPAARVHILGGAGAASAPIWLVQRGPDAGVAHFAQGRYRVELRAVRAPMVSILHVSRHPGAGVMAFGAALLVLGLLLVATYRREVVWVRCAAAASHDAAKSQALRPGWVEVAVQSKRLRLDTERRVVRLQRALERHGT